MHRARSPGRSSGTSSASEVLGVQHQLAPGKRTLVEGLAPVQASPGAEGRSALSRDAESAAAIPGARSTGIGLDVLFGRVPVPQARGSAAPGAADQAGVHAAAARGSASPASRLPHGDAIQRAFGRHDISGIQAHVSGEAAGSARDMGARAYATGDHVVFDGAPDLHTAAHEAAHVVQQRGGVQLKGNVGQAGDEHERHADSVADLIVQGKSAESLLDRYASASAGAAAFSSVQRKVVTAADPESEPMTVSCVPFAVEVAGNPVEKYARGASFRGHPTVLYMGHGNPDGTLSDVDVRDLIVDLSDPRHGMSPGSTLHLWSCFAARPASVAASLVDRVRGALEYSQIDRVTVTGVPNVSITDTHSRTLYTGIDETLHQPESGVADLVVGHAWVECGLLRAGGQAPVAGHQLWVPASGSSPPKTLKAVVQRLVSHGKRPPPIKELSHEELKQIAIDVFRECNRIFFSHPIIQDYVQRNLITSAPAALVTVQSTVLTDSIEERNPEYDEYMRERRNQSDEHGGEF